LMFEADLNGAGFGWGVGKYARNGVDGTGTLVTGFGGTEGYESAAARLLDDGYFIVFLGNLRPIAQGRIINDLWNTLLDFDVDPIAVVDNRPLEDVLNDALAAGDFDSMVEIYLSFRRDPANAAINTESAMNRVGYNLLGQDHIEQAIEVFVLNVGWYPECANAHDSLGEAYQKSGNLVLARENYQKAASLDPTGSVGESARKALQALDTE
jgi:tetratricopeptide (TPR) repeat protein